MSDLLQPKLNLKMDEGMYNKDTVYWIGQFV